MLRRYFLSLLGTIPFVGKLAAAERSAECEPRIWYLPRKNATQFEAGHRIEAGELVVFDKTTGTLKSAFLKPSPGSEGMPLLVAKNAANKDELVDTKPLRSP